MTTPIDAAVATLRAGGLVAFPTETVYGLGADASNAAAVRRLFAVKGRPPDHPVIAHVGDASRLDDYAIDVPDVARRLAAELWPGPLTLVVRRRPATIVDEVTGGRATVGLRVPDHPVALELLRAFGGAVAAPSANRFGRVSPTTAAHVRDDLGDDVDVVLDGGPCAVGVESTIVDCTAAPVRVLRVGGVTRSVVERVAGGPVVLATSGEVAASGTLEQHYAPRASVELVAPSDVAARARALASTGARVAVLGLVGDVASVTRVDDAVCLLEPARDVDEYAHVLYERLRRADSWGADVVVAVAPDDRGIGAAVCDRLRRAAAAAR
ncbi:MAG TPA: L-threonylcarbamoyladenylate synthase [Acidimicrobiia bacterium]|nr:L-threonylcarbamoyladenylate synthase [Acidimicrobiia bacterium]